jgi:hypothetical protein
LLVLTWYWVSREYISVVYLENAVLNSRHRALDGSH